MRNSSLEYISMLKDAVTITAHFFSYQNLLMTAVMRKFDKK